MRRPNNIVEYILSPIRNISFQWLAFRGGRRLAELPEDFDAKQVCPRRLLGNSTSVPGKVLLLLQESHNTSLDRMRMQHLIKSLRLGLTNQIRAQFQASKL